MQNIIIGRYDADPMAQGVIKPADGRWQLVIDKDGYPHLYVQVNVQMGEDTAKAMYLVEEMLPTPIRELMDGGEFLEEPNLTDEEAQTAMDQYNKFREENSIPCPS